MPKENKSYFFDRQYRFYGSHALRVDALTAVFDSASKAQLFRRNLDVYINAPLIGFLYGRMTDRDDTRNPSTNQVYDENIMGEQVKHKIFAVYAGLDKELKTGPTLLYLWLYFFCHDKDYCWPSQKLLSVLCKTTVRSVQNHLAALVRLEYIAVEQQGTRNIYRLLESDRVRRQIVEAGMELMEDENFSPLKLKLAEEKGEKSSCSLLKELKKKEEITDHLFYI